MRKSLVKRYIDADKLKEDIIVSGLFDSGELGVILHIVEEQPILEVPTPHGELIDRDYLLSSFVPSTEELVGMVLENSEAAKYTLAVAKVIENIVRSVPTIIEAEGVK